MVQIPAPNQRRMAKNASAPAAMPAEWTQRFATASASRLNRKVSLWTLASSALLFSGAVSTRSEASPPGLSPAFATKSVAPRAISPAQDTFVAAETVTSPLVVPVVVVPAVSASVPVATIAIKKVAPVLQIDGSGAISSQSLPPQAVSPSVAVVSALSATFSTLSTPESPLSSSSSLSSSQLQSQPISAPLSGARGLVSTPEITAQSAIPIALSPQATAQTAPNLASRPLALEVQTTMRISALVSGKERQAQIAVTPKMTVGQALAAMGVSLAVLDRVTPDISALARDGLKIKVTRVASQMRTTKKAIPAELRYKPTTKLRAGTKSTLQQAKNGTLEITERIWKRDGKITKREFVSQRVTVQPKPKIIALGVNSHLLPSNVRPSRRYARALSYRGGSPRDRSLAPADPRTFAPVKSFKVLATGYSAGPAGGAIGNWTATGVRCTYGAVAVDPRLIPLGSKLYVEGYGYGFACDVGGAIKGKHIDLAFDSPAAAFRHGKKQVTVWILGP